MKKIIKPLLIILIVLVAAAAGAAFRQRENILALINGTRYSTEDLASQLDSKREDFKTKVEKYTDMPVNDLSAEDEEKLFKGQITVEEIYEKYKLPLNVMKEDTTPKSEENSDSTKEADKIIGDGVSRMYALKAKYVSKLGELERTVYSEYSSLPKEQQTDAAKKEIVAKNIGIVSQMEKKCDKEVNDVLTELEEKLKELDASTEIVKVLKDAYNSEKALKKSYYLSLYSK